MTVIRRWECPTHGPDFGIASGSTTGTRWCQHCRIPASVLVEVEYVPASQLQGAVSALASVTALVDEALDTWTRDLDYHQVREWLERLSAAANIDQPKET